MANHPHPATAEASLQPAFITALLNSPACYDHDTASIRLIETHISWVLLTGRFAYKIKKPVDLGFLDFSTLELRQQACDDEVRLNRRLAADIYLEVVAISGSPESPRLNPQGDVFEYAVKMRQFPPDATLDKLSARGELGSEQIDTLAARLARFHLDECATAPADSVWGEPDSILQPVRENFRVLGGRLTGSHHARLERLHSWSYSEHKHLAPLMLERKQQGKIRECHGDLHLGNLAWDDGQLIIFDCIEFSAPLRWIDVISEVAFCFMDLLHRQHRDLAFRFLNAWLEATGDYRGVALLRYYAVYRAMVRAKVAALRAEQTAAGDTTELQECLQLAEQLIEYPQPHLWITHGLSGSGKTTSSQTMLQEQGLIRLRSDVERKRLAGIALTENSNSGIATGLYASDMSRRTYDYLAQQSENLLDAGWPVIVDAAFLARWQRNLFREMMRRKSITFHILDIQVPLSTLRTRITQRKATGRDASEADLRVLQHQVETTEPLDPDELKYVTA